MSFAYRDGVLHAEGVSVARIAAAVGTPFYVYSAASFTAQYRALAAALAPVRPLICYAVKANSNQAVLRLFAGLGAGADVVSEGELRRAFAAGIPAERIVFSGVGKTRAELTAALDADIHQINVESMPELRRLSDLASASGRTARVALRVNPDVDAETHAAISTGRKGDKFGIPYGDIGAAYRLAARASGDRAGRACGAYRLADRPARPVAGSVRARRRAGDGAARRGPRRAPGRSRRRADHPLPPERSRAGEPAEYAGLVQEVFGKLDVALAFEPGRFLVGAGGVLAASVVYVKEGEPRIVVVDAAMNDLVRPAMYEIEHAILPVREPAAGASLMPADVVGPVCESTATRSTAATSCRRSATATSSSLPSPALMAP